MRILVISKLYPPVILGGYELQCHATVAALKQTHEVQVLTTDFHSADASDESDVHRVLPFTPTYGVSLRRSMRLTLVATRRLRYHLRRFRPDLVYVFQGSGMPHAVMALLFATPLPVVINVGDYWLDDLFETDPFMNYLVSSRNSSRSIVVKAFNHVATHIQRPAARPVNLVWVSKFLQQRMVMPASIVADRQSVIRLSTPTSLALRAQFTSQRRPISPQSPHVLFCGRVVPEKGINLLVESLAQLRPEFPGIVLRVAGSCDVEAARALRGLAEERGLGAERLAILGLLEADALRAEFASADLFVMPSIWAEPGGMALMDAASAGVPVVASSAGGMPEILHPGEHAGFFPPGDREGLMDAIKEAVGDPALTERRRRAARGFFDSEARRNLNEAVRFIESCVAEQRSAA